MGEKRQVLFLFFFFVYSLALWGAESILVCRLGSARKRRPGATVAIFSLPYWQNGACRFGRLFFQGRNIPTSATARKNSTIARMKEENSVLVSRIGNVFHLSIPAGTTFLARISLFGTRTLKSGRIFHTRADRSGNLFRCPSDHRSRHANGKVFRERVTLTKKIFHHSILACRNPEGHLRKVFRDPHEHGKVFHTLKVARIMPAKVGNPFRLAGNKFRHGSFPSRIGKTFQTTSVCSFHDRKNIHSLESVAGSTRRTFDLAKQTSNLAIESREPIGEARHLGRIGKSPHNAQ